MKIDEYMGKVHQIQQQFKTIPEMQNQCEQILKTVTALSHQQLPETSLPLLDLSDDVILENIIANPTIMNALSELQNLRQVLIENLGIWHLCSQNWIADLQAFCGEDATNLELMAGNAMISANLSKTIATDNLNWEGQDIEHPVPWTFVEKLDAMDAVVKYYQYVDNIIMAWAPDHDQIDWQIVQFLRKKAYKGHFIVIGERNGATNSQVFWQNAQLELIPLLNRNHQPFDFIKDRVWLVK